MTVDVASVIHINDGDRALEILDLVDHAKVAPSSTVQPFEFEPERFPDSLGILDQSAVNKLNASRCDLLRQSTK